MEKTINGEQLEQKVESKNGVDEKEEMTQNTLETSSLSKFDSAEQLQKAYINLEKEFTKKCQALSKLQNSDNGSVPPQNFVDYKKLNEFFVKNPDAKQFADEILSKLDSDKVVDDNSLSNALEKVKASHFKSNEQLLNDANFVEQYVLTNKQIKDRILSDYLTQLTQNRPTNLMDYSTGANVVLTPLNKPKTLKEAGSVLASIINNK